MVADLDATLGLWAWHWNEFRLWGAFEVDSCNLYMKMTCLVEDRGRIVMA